MCEMSVSIDVAKLMYVRQLDMKRGSHNPNDIDMCVMEAVAYIAGEPWSDRPECSCPVIAAAARASNDRGNQSVRDRLRDRITRIAGSRSTMEV